MDSNTAQHSKSDAVTHWRFSCVSLCDLSEGSRMRSDEEWDIWESCGILVRGLKKIINGVEWLQSQEESGWSVPSRYRISTGKFDVGPRHLPPTARNWSGEAAARRRIHNQLGDLRAAVDFPKLWIPNRANFSGLKDNFCQTGEILPRIFNDSDIDRFEIGIDNWEIPEPVRRSCCGILRAWA